MHARLALPLTLLLLAGPAAAVGGTITDQAVSVTYPANHWGGSPWASFTGTEPVPTADVVYHGGWFYRVNGLDYWRDRLWICRISTNTHFCSIWQTIAI